MSKKKRNNRTLLIAFVILLALVIFTQIRENKKDNRTFKKELISIDTANVTAIILNLKNVEEEITLVNKGDSWGFTSQGEEYTADEGSISDMLGAIAFVKPERVAATNKSKWQEYEVDDSTGVGVKVKVNGIIAADFIIGKFSYQQPKNQYQRQGTISTYIRLAEEEKVYAVEGYLSMIFNKNIDALREKPSDEAID